MMLLSLLVSLIGTLGWNLALVQGDILCSPNDQCVYQCHCKNQCPGSDGQCPDNAKCDIGWFGARCQYRDLLTIPDARTNRRPWLTDRDDNTCNNDSNFQEVTVSWLEKYPVTGLRMVLNDTSKFSTVKIVYSTDEGFKECPRQRWSKVGERTMDIRCEENVLTNKLIIQGNVSSLCTLYISEGRNVAYRQLATQSSTYSERQKVFFPDLAVDGNKDSNFLSGSCSHTISESNPHFRLTFNSVYVIYQYILYNRDGGAGVRLQYFRLASWDAENKIVDSFKDQQNAFRQIYYIIGTASKPIKSIYVNETNTNTDGNFVTLCELEAYGECPPGKWSLPCTQDCPTSCPTSCDRDTGLCNTVCFGFSDPPECTALCKTGEWGINCRNICSTKCAYLSCHPKTGECTQGCLGYSDPPLCNTECLKSTWGVNCSQSCSSHCVNNTCRATNGTCHGGCKAGYKLPDCTEACPAGSWGVSCTNKCSNSCLQLTCDSETGFCDTGYFGDDGAKNRTLSLIPPECGNRCFQLIGREQKPTEPPVILGVYSSFENQQLDNHTYDALQPTSK